MKAEHQLIYTEAMKMSFCEGSELGLSEKQCTSDMIVHLILRILNVMPEIIQNKVLQSFVLLQTSLSFSVSREHQC